LSASQTSKRELKKISKNRTVRLANSTLILSSTDDKLNSFEYLLSKADESYSELYLTYKNLPKGRYAFACYVEGI
jgi:hypothetical protein